MSEPVSKKSAFVAIVGRPSAGKSTLMNTLCGEKVAISSPTPQTTRNRIRGIVTREEGQLVFVDTPGFHESRRSLNRHMRGLIDEAIRDSELLLYVVDSSREPGAEEFALMDAISDASIPRIVALNKIDAVPRARRDAILGTLRERLPDVPIMEISALRSDHTDELLDELFERAPTGRLHYSEEFYTDQDPEFRVSEIIREKALAGLRQELPHAIYVEVADMEIEGRGGVDEADPSTEADRSTAPDASIGAADAGRSADLPAGAPEGFFATGAQDATGSADQRRERSEERLWIRAFILVERKSQQGMIVGKGGAGIKRIRQAAQKEIARLFPYRIHLDLRVKVDQNWSRNEGVLGRLVK